MDLLSDVLRDLRLESAVLSMGEYRAPWGIDKCAVGGAPFHVVVEGRCFFEVANGEPVELSPGDLVVLPHGAPHSLYSNAGAPRASFGQILEANGIAATWRPGMRVGQLPHLRFGGDGAATRIINGVFAFQDRRRNPLLDALPDIIHVRGRLGRGAAWLEGSLGLLIDELSSGRPGFQTVAERTVDIVFVQAVRDHIANLPAHGSGWLRGLTDPQIAQTLSLVHCRLGEAWTLEKLARTVGLSRTSLASRFRTLVGSPVMEYVIARRMHVAAGLLASSSEALAGIADQVGYGSTISFSKAFRRWAGIPPGQYRRQMKATYTTTNRRDLDGPHADSR